MIEKKDDDIQQKTSKTTENITEAPSNSNVAESHVTAASLAESRQLLDLTYSRVQEDIKKSFKRLFENIESREKQLLRQVEVLHSQQLALLQSRQTPHCDLKNGLKPSIPQVLVSFEDERQTIASILSFGKVSLEGGSVVTLEGTNMSPCSVPYKTEDYQDAVSDHVCLYKSLSSNASPQHEVIKFGFVPKLLSAKSESTEDFNEEPGSNDSTEPKSEETSECEKGVEKERRPSQVQQWLQQIMVETETEPTVAELEKKFDSANNSYSSD